MRPTVAETRDPLNVEALPAFDGLELDYRTGCVPQCVPKLGIIRHSVMASTLALFALAILRMAGLFYFVTSPFVLACVVLICSAAALYFFLIRSEPYVYIAWLAAGPTIWALIVLTRGAGQFLICLIPIALATTLSHSIVRHFAAWMHANPYLHRKDRLAWLEIWQPERFAGASATPERLNVDLERAERDRYSWAPRVVAIAAVLALFTYNARRPFAGFMALSTFVILLFVYGVFNCLQYHGGHLSVLKSVRCVWRAIVSWLTYNADDLAAPGVFQSPCGPVSRRVLMSLLAVAGLTLTVVPLASYFPIGVMASSPEEWLRAAAAPLPWQRGPKAATLQLPTPPTREQVLARLTPAQRAYHDQLYSDAHRRVFLNQIATQHHAVAVDRATRPLFERLADPPESWLCVALTQVAARRTEYVWALVASAALCLSAGPLVLFAICFAVGSRVLSHFQETLNAQNALYQRDDADSAWEAYHKRLAESHHRVRDGIGRIIRERDHLFVGLNPDSDYPVLLHKHILTEHAHLTGDSGSGKSSLGIAPLLSQLIGLPRSSVVVIDLKGDMALFECARLQAQRTGVPFRWVTNRPREATYAFNPFLQSHIQRLTREQLGEVLLKSLGLEYGPGYGRAFFSAMHRDMLIRLLATYPEINSFRTLHQYLTHTREFIDVTPEQMRHGIHLRTMVNMLGAIDALNISEGDDVSRDVFDRRIDFSEVIHRPNVIYFHLHAQLQEATMREVAKLALFSLLTAAVLDHARDHQVYLFVDEFQQVVSTDVEIVLRMARDAGIATILANQTISDLVTREADLRPTVQANTRFKVVYSATDLQQQDTLIKSSGDAMYEQFSILENPETGFVRGLSIGEHIAPRLMRNDVIRASDAENLSIAHIARSFGYSQYGGFPFTMYTAFHIPFDEYMARKRTPWPRCGDFPGTFVPPIRREDDTRGGPVPRSPLPAQPPPAIERPREIPEFVEQQQVDDIGALLDDFQ